MEEGSVGGWDFHKQQKHTQSPVAAALQPEKDSKLGEVKTTDPDWVYVQIAWWKKNKQTFLSALGPEVTYISFMQEEKLNKDGEWTRSSALMLFACAL